MNSKESKKEIRIAEKVDVVFNAPPSKAYTLRALFISALAEGRSVLRNALNADDQKIAVQVLSAFGAKIIYSAGNYLVDGTGGTIKAPKGEVFTGNSGVTTRFIIPVAAIAEGTTIITGDERMNHRPIEPLTQALASIGGIASCGEYGGTPIEVKGGGLKGGRTSVSGSGSSQFLSALLISAPYTNMGLLISVDGELKSKPYIDNTIECMSSFGVPVVNRGYKEFFVRGRSSYKCTDYVIEGDYSSASYFFAAAAVTGGKVKVNNLNPASSQADKFFLECLAEMGCGVKMGKDFVEVQGGKLTGIEVNMADCPDVVPTLAIVAAFADGKTRITGIGHLAVKESNRIESTVSNLKKCGVPAVGGRDIIEIIGKKPSGAEIETYNDHRIAMAFSVMGLKVPGIIIKDPDVVSKSYPEFFDELEKVYE